jgi:hypothetical protein
MLNNGVRGIFEGNLQKGRQYLSEVIEDEADPHVEASPPENQHLKRGNIGQDEALNYSLIVLFTKLILHSPSIQQALPRLSFSVQAQQPSTAYQIRVVHKSTHALIHSCGFSFPRQLSINYSPPPVSIFRGKVLYQTTSVRKPFDPRQSNYVFLEDFRVLLHFSPRLSN